MPVKALNARLRRLEDRLIPPDYSKLPPKRERIIVEMIGGPPGLDGAQCSRRLSPDGRTIFETVILAGSGQGVTKEDMDGFADQFPVKEWSRYE